MPEATPARTSARDVAYSRIRERIISGEEQPGALLSENELAVVLGLSRTPVREALLLIAQEGLVEVRPQRGTYVTYINPAVVAQAQFIREAIEIASLRECVRQFQPEHAKPLRAVLAQQELCTSREEFYPLDEQFHRMLLAIAGHETAWATVANAKGHLDRARYLGLSGFRGIEEYVHDHRSIVDAIERGDLAAAEDSLRMHLRFVLDDVDAMRLKRPELFDASPLPERRAPRAARA
ncbi:GntR family transcriptional regulator [Arthrobacter sp. 35W]|uniref:GntR family transcriptional regulator n=1 Tax=Arthrobacter sp. 35W TaxID=1132441 RepID=UPI000478DA64|nr:GntR family transcriptional regulator [Arthrobacter sp. 35W]